MSYEFLALPPSRETELVVKAFFKITSAEGDVRKDFLLPDGLPSFFYLQSSQPIETIFGETGQPISLQNGFYVGYSNTLVEFMHAGMNIVGASIYPVYFKMIFDISPSEIINRFAPVRIEALQAVADLMNSERDTMTEIVNVFEQYVTQQLTNHPGNYDFETLYRKLIGPGGYTLGVEQLAESLGFSTRALNSWFKQHFGMSPKQFMKLVKFNQALKHIYERTADVKLSDIAHEVGYHDQSHFIRDFKSICGKTPKELLGTSNSLSNRFRLF
ncbi:helix-turn-helix domain-containing protein [Chryseolinea lacunae]|uniref:Helix-turn-helix transcriptional regulator n=1 Tax=Chryseolinea lacunae TaxID=2801331 RepID=A0ABS1L1V2_9BACT|nr:helix-turn-helix transcriptional regulator [Chryseolinea lacunae]MBL0745674.1 helix-turn-helix transcriptional regulator [Chryseolinea lacunae]